MLIENQKFNIWCAPEVRYLLKVDQRIFSLFDQREKKKIPAIQRIAFNPSRFGKNLKG
jgi:hypothetical protein